MKNGRVEPKTEASKHTYFETVWAWHQELNQPIGASFADANETDADLGAKLVTEEFAELIQAYLDGDAVELADAAADLIWVVCGLMVRLGIDLDPVWAEVTRTNYAKVGGPVRSDGKLQKPIGWQPPDIEGALDRGRSLVASDPEEGCPICKHQCADTFEVSATSIACKHCGAAWARCNGVWRLDPNTVPELARLHQGKAEG